MDRYRLKNIIILILVLVNLFLLGSLGQRRIAEHHSYKTSVEQLSALLAADGVSLDSSLIPSQSPPAIQSFSRSPDADRKAASFLLGDAPGYAEQGGGIYTYSGERGAALFRSNGSFEAAGTLAPQDGEEFCRKFSRQFGYDEPSFQLDIEGTGTAVSTRRWDRLPVYNCTITFTLVKNTVVAVSGTLLPDVSTEFASEVSPLSALAALNVFQQFRQGTGAVVTAIIGIEPCYELQSTTAAPLSLVPAWCIITDTASYYVNAVTGSIRPY